VSENFTSNQKLKSDALDKRGCKNVFIRSNRNNGGQKMLGHTIVTSQLGSAVHSHAVVTKTVATTQKLQFTNTLVGKLTPINCHDNCTINVPTLKRSPTAPCDEVRKRERVECGSDQCIGCDQCSTKSRRRLRNIGRGSSPIYGADGCRVARWHHHK
jgi:hypothetical protein